MTLLRSFTAYEECLHAAHDLAVAKIEPSRLGLIGYGVAWLTGESELMVPFANTVTDTGDTYHAQQVITGVAPVSAAAPTRLTGMQIGSSATAVNKAAGTGVAMGTLLAGQAFDATYPQTAALGVNAGTNAVYKTTYAAGTGTGTVTEATLTNGTVTVASTTGNTIARTTFTGIVKGAGDSLALTWNVKFLGT